MSLINYDQGRIAQSENGPTSLTVALGGTMNLSQLNYFKKLAEVLHYTRAAQELFITQPDPLRGHLVSGEGAGRSLVRA